MKEEILYREDEEEKGLIKNLYQKFIPYWLLFVLLSGMLGAVAVLYTRTLTPTYKINASLAISDEDKGAGEAPLLRSLNIYTSKKIVENEIQVLQSRSLIRAVVDSLLLCTPVYEKEKSKVSPAYVTSPVRVRIRDPKKIIEKKEIPFSWNAASQKVTLINREYPLEHWIQFPFGTIRFEPGNHPARASNNKLFFSINDPRKVVEDVSKKLKISGTGKTATIITFQYTDEVPKRGEDILNTLLSSYRQFSIATKNQLAKNTLEFIDERLQRVTAELDAVEKRVQNFRTTQGVVDISQQGRIYLENVAENDRKVADLNMQLAVLNQVEKYVQSRSTRSGIIPTSLGISDPVLSSLLQQLNDLELKYANLRATTSENNPAVSSVESEISMVRPHILSIVENQRARLTASRNNQQQSSQEYSEQLRSLPTKERTLLDISRQQSTLRDIYTFLLQKREEAALTNASVISDSHIIDKAEASTTASTPSKIIFLFVAIVLSFIITVAYIIARDYATTKVLFRSTIKEETDIPVIGELIYLKKATNKRKGATLQYQLNQLQAALGLFDHEAGEKTLMVTSWLSKEGKTFVAGNLGKSIAATGKKVVIVDLDLYPKEARHPFSTVNQKGVTDYIQCNLHPESIIHPTTDNNLFLISAGAATATPLPLLLNPKLKDLVKYLESKYDLVLIDTPSLGIATDGYAIAGLVDKIIFVVKHSRTPQDVLKRFNENLDKKTAIVFNSVKGRGLFKNYYGFGYGYGSDPLRHNTQLR